MQTALRMEVNVFNLVNGSYKSKYCQKPYNKYTLKLALHYPLKYLTYCVAVGF